MNREWVYLDCLSATRVGGGIFTIPYIYPIEVLRREITNPIDQYEYTDSVLIWHLKLSADQLEVESCWHRWLTGRFERWHTNRACPRIAHLSWFWAWARLLQIIYILLILFNYGVNKLLRIVTILFEVLLLFKTLINHSASNWDLIVTKLVGGILVLRQLHLFVLQLVFEWWLANFIVQRIRLGWYKFTLSLDWWEPAILFIWLQNIHLNILVDIHAFPAIIIRFFIDWKCLILEGYVSVSETTAVVIVVFNWAISEWVVKALESTRVLWVVLLIDLLEY